MSEPLRPCPFCGGPGYACQASTYWVRCDDCFAESRGALTPEEAAANWNSRTTDATVATLTAEVARLKALLGEFTEDTDAGYISDDNEDYCQYCFLRATHRLYQTPLFDHTPGCIITRARAVLTPEATP